MRISRVGIIVGIILALATTMLFISPTNQGAEDSSGIWIEQLLNKGNGDVLLGVCEVINNLLVSSSRLNQPGELGFSSGVPAGLYILREQGLIIWSNDHWIVPVDKAQLLEEDFKQYCPQSEHSHQ